MTRRIRKKDAHALRYGILLARYDQRLLQLGAPTSGFIRTASYLSFRAYAHTLLQPPKPKRKNRK